MSFKSILQYEMFFWAIIMLLVSSFTVYYGWTEKIGIESLYIYGCPYNKLNCLEEEKIVIDLEVDHEYNFRTNPDGTVYDPYGHYARKKRISYYLIAAIILLGAVALFKLYRAIKSNPKIMEYIRRRRKEHGKENI